MNSFSSRLKKLRKENNLTQVNLANDLGYSRSTIANYEQKVRQPSTDVLNKIADYFDVSIDYLLGRSNISLRLEEYFAQNTSNILKNEKVFKKILDSLITAFSKITQYKTPYKKNHSQNVAELSWEIGEHLDLPTKRLHSLKIASLLHDIGELNIPDVILNKPGKLTKNEYNLIKDHPIFSYNIIKTIKFDQSIAKIVLQHHEKIDGSGYPNGLNSNTILIEAKILAVADTVEAMTSKRPHRKAFGIDYALNEISKKSNITYDKEVTDICLKLFKNDMFSFERK